MSLHIILGGADADRTKYCFDIMQTIPEKDRRVCMIVPDQYSYAAEKNAIKVLGGTGINGIEVLTFNRIVFRIRQNISQPDYITAAGREMLVCKAIQNVIEEDSIFYGCVDKAGFINIISGLISEFKRYSLTPEIVNEQSRMVSGKVLSDKLSDISKIYSRYEELISGNFSDSDNDLDVAAEYIKSSGMFNGYTVFFDAFSDFLPQNMRVVEEIMKDAADVYVTLCIPDEVHINDDTFETCRNTYHALRAIAHKNSISIEDTMLPDTKQRSEEIRFMLKNWGDVGKKYDGEVNDISIFYAKNPYSEVEYAAAEIVKRVREEDMRFRDISVLCGDMNAYGHIIQSTFAEYDIPYFTDERTAVTDHPVITAIGALLNIVMNDWRYDDVFNYLKAGFVYRKNEKGRLSVLDSCEIDKLENYVLKWGIRGRKQWLSDEKWRKKRADIFGAGGADEIDEQLDALRREIAVPIENFRQKASGKNAVKKAAALFEFLEEINMPDGIEMEINLLRERGLMDEAAQFEQVWELLVEAIEQVYVAIGNEKCSMEEFARYITAGLSMCDIRIIPSSLDHVAVGTVSRSRTAEVREVFVIGANYGMIPPDISREGILSNADRNELEKNIRIAPDTKKRDVAERYKVYNSLCSAREKLHISYAAANSEGDTLRPSQFVIDIMNMFPQVKQNDDMITSADTVQTVKSAFRALMLHLDDDESVWAQIRRRFEEDEEYSPRIKHILSSCYAQAGLQSKTAHELFENKRRSVTQFEKYASCPYSYFLQYGLKVYSRDVWEVNGINIGNLCHRIVQEYCERVSEGLDNPDDVKNRWHHMTDEESTGIISTIIDSHVENCLEKAIHGKGKLRSILNRIRRIVYTSVNTINTSLRMGDYAYTASEKTFEYNIGGADIFGIIDRVDISEQNGMAYIRIVDYKSGRQGFDLAKVAAGINMQMVTYAIAAKNMYEQRKFFPRQSNFSDVRIGGILYNKIRDDIVVRGDVGTAMSIRDTNRKMTGIIFADTVDELRYMDNTISEGVKSEFLKVSVNADGSISKVGECETSDVAEHIIKHTERLIKKAQSNILSGEIPVKPYLEGTSSPCQYCEYGEICAFDGKKESYKSITTDKDMVMAIIRGEVDA